MNETVDKIVKEGNWMGNTVTAVFRICNSYESGVGKGLDNSKFKDGEHLANPEEKEAYIIGYKFGERKRKAKEPLCANCDGQKWVCEDHPEVPWNDGEGCCGGAGMPCVCNQPPNE